MPLPQGGQAKNLLGQGANLLEVFAGDGVGFACVVLKAHGIVFGIDNGLFGADVDGVILRYGNVLGATGGEHKGAHHQGKDQGGLFHAWCPLAIAKRVMPSREVLPGAF